MGGHFLQVLTAFTSTIVDVFVIGVVGEITPKN